MFYKRRENKDQQSMRTKRAVHSVVTLISSRYDGVLAGFCAHDRFLSFSWKGLPLFPKENISFSVTNTYLTMPIHHLSL